MFKILDAAKTEVRYNSEWLGKLGYEGTIRLTAHFTVTQMLERDEFHKRFQAEQPISLHELLYPLMQGYDSVALECDVELGGTDQKFNLMCGRELQRHYSQKPQIVLMTPILEGLDGVQKMSKSLNNAIGIKEPPAEMYGKLMSISDELMWKYWVFLTDLTQSQIDAMRADVRGGQTASDGGEEAPGAHNHGGVPRRRGGASRGGELGEDVPAEGRERGSGRDAHLYHRSDQPGSRRGGCMQMRVAKLLVQLGLAASGAEANRKITEKAVKINGEVVTSQALTLDELPARLVVRLGKRAKAAVVGSAGEGY